MRLSSRIAVAALGLWCAGRSMAQEPILQPLATPQGTGLPPIQVPSGSAGGTTSPGTWTIRAWVSGRCRVLRGESRAG